MRRYPGLPEVSWLLSDVPRSAAPILFVIGLVAALSLGVLWVRV